MGALTAVSKGFLYFINTVFLALGLAICGLGIWAVVEGKNYGINDVMVPVAVIVLGALVFLLSFFGCFGAYKISKCLLYTYAVIVAALLIVILVVGIVLYVNPEKIDQYAIDAWNSSTGQNNTHLIEEFLGCCNFYNDSATFTNGSACTTDLGCFEATKAVFNKYLVPIAAVGFTLVATMFFGVLFAILLACKGEAD